MKGSQANGWRCGEQLRASNVDGRFASQPIVLAPFSTRLPPEVLERLRVAAPQLGLRQCEIAAAALDLYLAEEGF
jgi:hypothetical protein